jgi:hypothetical protein
MKEMRKEYGRKEGRGQGTKRIEKGKREENNGDINNK